MVMEAIHATWQLGRQSRDNLSPNLKYGDTGKFSKKEKKTPKTDPFSGMPPHTPPPPKIPPQPKIQPLFHWKR